MSAKRSTQKERATVSRRHFLFCTGLFAGGTLVGLPRLRASSPVVERLPPVEAYLLSLRGRRGSNAGELHNHFHVFASSEAADSHRAHSGDNSRIVAVSISRAVFEQLFTSRGTAIADVRNLEVIEPFPLPTDGPVSQARFKRGDVDGNGEIDINDPVRLLNHLFNGEQGPDCPDAADADDNGELTINDPQRSLNWLFLGGPAPPSPGPRQCGRDLTPSQRLGPCKYDSQNCE